jgi:rubrerythrin
MNLDALDRDGALQEAEDRLARHSRAGLLAGAVTAGAALAGLRPGAARGVTAIDRDILNYALTLEYLQASFYTEAERLRALRGRAARAANVVGAVERAHVKAFRKLLGSAAVKRPAFDFQGTTDDQQAFLKTAVALEDLAVAAYKDQAPKIQDDAVLAAAVAIHSVEARHAAWMRHMFGIQPAVAPFDEARPRAEIERIVASTRFIASRPLMRAKGRPRFTG